MFPSMPQCSLLPWVPVPLPVPLFPSLPLPVPRNAFRSLEMHSVGACPSMFSPSMFSSRSLEMHSVGACPSMFSPSMFSSLDVLLPRCSPSMFVSWVPVPRCSSTWRLRCFEKTRLAGPDFYLKWQWLQEMVTLNYSNNAWRSHYELLRPSTAQSRLNANLSGSDAAQSSLAS